MKKIFIVAAFITSKQLVAQDTTLLSDVTVTANKFAMKTTQTGKVVQIITRQDIDRSGARDVAQVINEQGGVYINGANSSPGKDKNIYLRGAKVDYTLITIDGVPVYDASGIGSNFDIRQLPLDLVEKIEILKGSQGTLYGSDAIAGVINIITKKPAGKKLSVHGDLMTGSINGARTNTYLTPDTYKLNLGVSGQQNKIDYQAGFTRFITDGISEATEAGFPANEEDSFRQTSAHAKIGLLMANGIRIQPFIRFSHIHAELDQEPFVDEKDFTSKNANTQAGVLNDFKIGNADARILYQLNVTSRDYLDDSAESANGFLKYSNYIYESSEHFAEAFLVYPLGSTRITTGVDFRAAAAEYSYTTVSKPFPPFPSSTSNFSQGKDSTKHSQAGLYAAAHIAGGKGFFIETGGRLNYHSEYGTHFAFNINPSFVINSQLKLFANVSSGYKTPSLYQLYSEFGNKELDPESSVNLEGGIQFFTKDQKANLRATYFNRDVKDVISFFFDPVTFEAKYINQDKQKDHGYEVDGQLRASDKLTLKLLYSHIDGEVTTKVGDKDTTYSNLIRRPENSLSLHLGSQLSPKFFISGGAQYVGEAKDLYFNPMTWTNDEVKLEKYVLLNIYSEYKVSNSFKVFADLRNLTDEKYTEVYGYKTPGFNWHLGIRFNR